ncbi:glycosyltransferase family 4 protein [Chitinophaga vietnamensis]|uniref:glycosyltransferase family 4 protein n=1 Tax=Chitinophaga vietnamensis TaxID=2593957 RepID=UPI00117768FF|nr:glycosyltransferase family 1 protein [Chitinophaga vietnamensis]
MSRFLIDCERMKYPNTGLYTYCSELGKAILKQANAGEAVYYYLPSKAGAHFGPKAHYLAQQSWHKIFMPYRQQFDVWHTTYQSSDYAPGNRKVKRLLTLHDLNFLYEDNHVHKKDRLLAKVQRTVDQSDHLVVISKYVKDDIMQHLHIGNKPISVIYNGCHVEEFPGFDAPKYRPAGGFLFSIGTVLPKKNFHVLPCLLANNAYELVIAGNVNEAYKARILQEAAIYGVQDRVKIIGPVNEKDKYWYLSNCTAFTFPSVAEGFGIPVIEAMHFGKPVFLSDKTSLPEVGGSLAYYFSNFEPADMQEIFRKGLAHYAQYQTAAAIRKHADAFRWDDIAAQYLRIYRSLAG